MSWGIELWDQYENISLHTQKGIDFLERYGHFIKDRSNIEMEYAKNLRKLVKTYQPKKKDEEDYQYTPCRAFKHVMTEVSDLAGQHEVIAENLHGQVINEISTLVKEFREDRKRYLQDGAKMMGNLSNQIAALDRAKKNYEKSFKEAERALENFQRADADYNLSRAEVEKQKNNMTYKSQICEESKNEYASQLQKTNELQAQHYQQMMPDVFHHLQELDEKRIKNIKNFMLQSVDIERNVFPIVNKCLDGIVSAANEISEKEDTKLVVERYKSGFPIPGDLPFEDLTAVRAGESVPVPQYVSRPELTTIKGTLSGGKLKKRVALFGIFSSNKNNISAFGDNKEDFSDLAPNQRKKKLQQRIEELQKSIQQDTATRDGLMKMKGVYEANPSMGDPMSIEGQLNECSHRLEKLHQELNKFQLYLDEARGDGDAGARTVNGSPSAPNRKHKGASLLNGIHSRNHRSSSVSGGEEDSLSRSASDSSVSNPTSNLSRLAGPQTGSSHSPESGLGTSRTSLHSDADQDHVDHGEHVEHGELLDPLGTARALYPFDATSEGSIPMNDGEELYLIEVDQGDGWTRVRRLHDLEEGFVPTSYIDCTLFA